MNPQDGDVRTPDRPMAFTRGEFRLGAFAAWVAFMILLVVALIVTAVQQSGLPWGSPSSMIALYLMFGVPIGGAVSAVVTLASAPVARVLARRLAGTRRISVHVAAYAAFGALLGFAVLGVAALLTGVDFVYIFSTPFAWLIATLCAFAVVGGWAWTMWWHLHRPSPRPHPDALAEDAL